MNKTSSFRPPSVHLTAKEEISLEGKNSSLILDNETHVKESKISEWGIPVPVMYQERMMPITKKYNSSKKKEEEKNFVLDLLGYYDAKKIVEDVKEGEVGLDPFIAGASFTPPGKAAKAIKTGGKGIKKVWNKMTGKDKAVALSKNNIQYIKKHIFEGMKEQVKYLSDKQLEAKLRNTSLFNKKWSEKEVIEYTQQAYNKLVNEGKTGKQAVKIKGETIVVYIKPDGKFDTAYGIYRYTVKDFR